MCLWKVRQCCWINPRMVSYLIVLLSLFPTAYFTVVQRIIHESGDILILGGVVILFFEMLGLFALVKEKPIFLIPLLICDIIGFIVMIFIAGQNLLRENYQGAVLIGLASVILWFVASVFHDYYMETYAKIQRRTEAQTQTMIPETQENPGIRTNSHQFVGEV